MEIGRAGPILLHLRPFFGGSGGPLENAAYVGHQAWLSELSSNGSQGYMTYHQVKL